jgi:hypothetical protein
MIGSGEIEGICDNVCNTWYQKCYFDLFTANPSWTAGPFIDQSDVKPCGKGSLICSPMNLIFKSSNEFCEAMGF